MTPEYKRWYERMMTDPVRHEEYLKRKRERHNEYYRRKVINH